jgi:hypothetical protein
VRKVAVPIWVLLTLLACGIVVEVWLIRRNGLVGLSGAIGVLVGYFVGKDDS